MNTPRIVRESLRIAAAHPSLPGHFPGNPVVPGVVLLDGIAGMIERIGAGTLRRLTAVKFLAPVLPDEWLECVIECDGERLRFHATRHGVVVLRGEGMTA